MKVLVLSALLFSMLVNHRTNGSENIRVCYYTNWSKYRPNPQAFNIDKDYEAGLCTHLIYSFARLTGGATNPRIEDVDASAEYPKLQKLKTIPGNENLKILIAIGGWTYGTAGFTAMASTSETRRIFAQNAAKYIEDNGFDGLDLDWEYPAARGSPDTDKEKFTLLCQQLRSVFSPKGLLLSAAVAASPYTAGRGYEIGEISKSLDFINLMTYDLHGPWESMAGHQSTTDINRPFSVIGSVNFWLSNGASPNKLVLGLPLYGRTQRLVNPGQWELGSPTNGPGARGQYTREAGFLSYYEACKINFVNKVSTAQSSANAPYGHNGQDFICYDDKESITYKVKNIAVKKGLKGVMFWAIDLDDFSGSCGSEKYPLIKVARKALGVEGGEGGEGDEGVGPSPAVSSRTTTAATAAVITTNAATAVITTVASTTVSSTTNSGESNTIPSSKTTSKADYCRVHPNGPWKYRQDDSLLISECKKYCPQSIFPGVCSTELNKGAWCLCG